MKTIWETETVDEVGAAGTVTQARHVERGRESVPDVCRWSKMAIRDMTMVDADAALAADPLFHFGSDGHLGRVDVRYWYFRLELKYFTCRACSEGGDPSAIEPEAVGCEHRIRPGASTGFDLGQEAQSRPPYHKETVHFPVSIGGPDRRARVTSRSGVGRATLVARRERIWDCP